jgi:catechol 2,3-dioxygenase-like lactoylglutathione lyase family enzyme
MTALLSMKTKIVTPRVEVTRDWYRDLFRLTVLEEWNDPNDCGCILGLRSTPGEALLEIHRRSVDTDYGGMGLQFRVDDVDAFAVPAEARFRSRGPVIRPWGSRYLFFEDPNGISVVVFSGSSL